jgi:DNA-directed RNA polymerase specialized sigma24 family protein
VPAFQLAAADPEAAPALPAALEPALRELCEGLGWSVVRLVEDALPALDPVRRRIPGADDEGAFLAWAYTLAVDEALDRLSARGLLTPPATDVTAVRVTDPALDGWAPPP